MQVNYESGFLFGTPSFLEGAGRVMDLAGSFDDYNRIGTSENVDALMLCLDWAVVGGDLRDAILSYLQGTAGHHAVSA